MYTDDAGTECCILAPLERCGLEVVPEPSNAHGSHARNASASATSIEQSDAVVGNSRVATSDHNNSSSGLPSNQANSLHSSCSSFGNHNKATERGSSLLVNSLLSTSVRQSTGRRRGDSDNNPTTSEDEVMSEVEISLALQSDTIRSVREDSDDSTTGARGGRHHPKGGGGGAPAAPARRRDGRTNHGSSTRRRDFGEVRAGIGTAVSDRGGSKSIELGLDDRSQMSVASADNEDGETASTIQSAAEMMSADVACSPTASPTGVTGFSWSGPQATPPSDDDAPPLRRARTSANVSYRRAVQALASDTMSLRARRRTEGREAGQLRQQVFKSLGVGSKRTVRTTTDGKGGQVVLAKVSTPALRAPS